MIRILNDDEIKKLKKKWDNEKNNEFFDEHNILFEKKYWWKCSKNHSFCTCPRNILLSKVESEGCKYCAKKAVWIGENDLWTTNPNIAKLLLNKEDGYSHTQFSNRKVKWSCPDCGYIFERSPAKTLEAKVFCKKCGNMGSYGERFFANILFEKKVLIGVIKGDMIFFFLTLI